jgi:hypothetical protein
VATLFPVHLHSLSLALLRNRSLAIADSTFVFNRSLLFNSNTPVNLPVCTLLMFWPHRVWLQLWLLMVESLVRPRSLVYRTT